jgi:hypothetical protein
MKINKEKLWTVVVSVLTILSNVTRPPRPVPPPDNRPPMPPRPPMPEPPRPRHEDPNIALGGLCKTHKYYANIKQFNC